MLTHYKADKETEKLIQYIIRIEDNSRNYIATNGTTDFTAGNGKTYQVAKEGEKVLVKLTIPEGKELVAAYWDQAKSEAGRLLQDAEGNYYLEVPRGGGVELSVVLKDIPKPEPETQPEPEPKEEKNSVASPLLMVWDADHKVEISFYNNRKFVATMEDGSKENGSYRQADGKIILMSGGSEITIADDGTFTYTSQNNASLSYRFDLSQGEMDILMAVK